MNNQNIIINKANKKSRLSKCLVAGLSVLCISLTACQSLPKPKPAPVLNLDNKLVPKRLDSFNITGKLGFVNKEKNQSGSAFYAWDQQQDRFAMDLQGALGAGYTSIEYNGKTASLTNTNVGTITASTPEALLIRATGWNAPISQLPYWISGSPAPTDSAQSIDDKKRLINAKNGNWVAKFVYRDNEHIPKKITALHNDNSKVVFTINHNE